MLEFWKDGKKVELVGIYCFAEVGDNVIYGEHVNWGNDATAEKYPLSEYEVPSLFTIVEKNMNENYYALRDVNGKIIKINISYNANHLFRAQDWLNWSNLCQTEKLARKQRKIEQLEGHVAILKDILIKQGYRVISDSQAKNLNID